MQIYGEKDVVQPKMKTRGIRQTVQRLKVSQKQMAV